MRSEVARFVHGEKALEDAKKITNAFVDVLGCPPDWVNVVFRETNPASYYTAGISVADERAQREKEKS